MKLKERRISEMEIVEKDNKKLLKSPDYNYLFDKETGVHFRWGFTHKDDPDFSSYGPEIMDIEIGAGQCSGNCSFCYKANGSSEPAENMTLDQFKELFETFPKTLTQIAFGITDIDNNPEFFEIMAYARSKGVIPNYTTSGKFVSKEDAQRTSELCGAVAVSLYDKDECYNAVKKFVDAGMTQVNIHYMLAHETQYELFKLIDDVKTDHRLKGLNAIVLLQYKPHGRGKDVFSSATIYNYKKIIEYAENRKAALGFDSCSAPLYFKAIEDDPHYKSKVMYAEPCESGLFSFYMNVKGEYFPCSFAEGEGEWKTGISGFGVKDFVSEIWNHPRILKWREDLINSSKSCDCKSSSICRSCPLYREVTACKDERIYLKLYELSPSAKKQVEEMMEKTKF